MMPKSTDAWMPLYWGDYLRDTPHLTTTQHGAYLLLIGAYWSHGPLPDDPTALASITRLSESEWQRHRQTLSKFFSIADGMWHHKRIDTERAKAIKLKEVRSKAGLSGAAMRWPTSNRMANASVCHEVATSFAMTPSPSPSPSPLQDTKNQESRTGQHAEKHVVQTRRKACRLDPSWKPAEAGIAFATKRGLDPVEQLAAFHDWAAGSAKAVKLDWDASWRQWCRSPYQQQPNRKGNGKGNGTALIDRTTVAEVPYRDSETPISLALKAWAAGGYVGPKPG